MGVLFPQVWPIRELPMPPPFVPQKPTEVLFPPEKYISWREQRPSAADS